MPAVVRLQVLAYSIHCQGCGWSGLVPSGDLQPIVAAHRIPTLYALHVRTNGGPLELWQCPNPRPLTR